MLKRLLIILITLLIMAAAAAVFANNYYNSMLEPVDPEAEEAYSIVDIPSGANTETIAAILYEEGLIQNQLVFRLYVRFNNLGQGFMAGRYQLSPAMSMEELIAKLQAGEIYTETAWFTIPEGMTVEEIAKRLEEKGLIDKERFLSLARQPSPEIIEAFPYLEEVDNPEIDYMLEGYLFPDTYEIYAGAGEEEIIKIMLRRMDQIINEELKRRIDEIDLNLHEILIIASLIEREARVDHERSLVSSVIYNRLEIGQRLQIDATIQYILGETKEFLLHADLEVPSPYNTYQNDGLPPGPIAAPGEASILAALFPEDTDYYYYNYKYDDSGEHYFSRTLEEHEENVRRAEENLQ